MFASILGTQLKNGGQPAAVPHFLSPLFVRYEQQRRLFGYPIRRGVHNRWAIVSDDGETEGLGIITEAKYGFSCRDGQLGASLL